MCLNAKHFQWALELQQCSICAYVLQALLFLGLSSTRRNLLLHIPSAIKTVRRLLLLVGNTWVSAGGTSLYWSLALLCFPTPPHCCRHLLLLSPRLEKTGDGDGGGATWGEQAWHESCNHRSPLSVTLAGVCQPAARYSASLALKIIKKKQ